LDPVDCQRTINHASPVIGAVQEVRLRCTSSRGATHVSGDQVPHGRILADRRTEPAADDVTPTEIRRKASIIDEKKQRIVDGAIPDTWSSAEQFFESTVTAPSPFRQGTKVAALVALHAHPNIIALAPLQARFCRRR
jgi:hypothetical protein